MGLSTDRYGNTSNADMSQEAVDRFKRLDRAMREDIRNCRAKQNGLKCFLDASHKELGNNSDHIARVDGHFEGENWVEAKLVKFSTKKILDGTFVEGDQHGVE